MKFASVAAPDQSPDFIKSVIHETNISFKGDREIPIVLKALIQIYEKSDTLEKNVILSIADHNKYSKDSIMKYFHCTKYKADQARKLKILANGLEMPKKATITRSKLKLVSAIFHQFLFFSPKDSPSKTMESPFYFI